MEQSDALRTVSKWLNEEIGSKPPLQEMAELCAEMQMGRQLRVKLGNQFGDKLKGQWYWLLPVDEFARRALIEHTTANVQGEPPRAASSREVGSTAGLGGAVTPAPTFGETK